MKRNKGIIRLCILAFCMMLFAFVPRVSYAAGNNTGSTRIYLNFGTGKCRHSGQLVQALQFSNVKYGTKITLPSISQVVPADNTYRLTGFMLKRLWDQKWFTRNNTWSKSGTKKLYKPGTTLTYKKLWQKGLSELSFFRFYAQYERVHLVNFREPSGKLYQQLQVAKNQKFKLVPSVVHVNQMGWYASRKQGNARYWYCTNKKWCSDTEIKSKGYKKKIYKGGSTYKLNTSWTKGYSGWAEYDFYPVYW